MFGFDGNTKGFEKIIECIASNHDGRKLNHKKVRAYARCLLIILPEIKINFNFSEIEILLTALSASDLPHYDRAFLASQILELIEDTKVKTDLNSDDDSDIPF